MADILDAIAARRDWPATHPSATPVRARASACSAAGPRVLAPSNRRRSRAPRRVWTSSSGVCIAQQTPWQRPVEDGTSTPPTSLRPQLSLARPLRPLSARSRHLRRPPSPQTPGARSPLLSTPLLPFRTPVASLAANTTGRPAQPSALPASPARRVILVDSPAASNPGHPQRAASVGSPPRLLGLLLRPALLQLLPLSARNHVRARTRRKVRQAERVTDGSRGAGEITGEIATVELSRSVANAILFLLSGDGGR